MNEVSSWSINDSEVKIKLQPTTTTTNINRTAQITMLAITFCNYNRYNTQDMILVCDFPNDLCEWHNLTLYNRDGTQLNCVQLNYGKNKTELVKAVGEGWQYSYDITFYTPNSYILFTATDNSARVVGDEVREVVNSGQETQIALSKTVQTALGPPYSQCNEAEDYRQVTCNDDCFNKAMSELCRCAYPAGCGTIGSLTKECQVAYNYSRSAIQSICNNECPDECNQISFPLNRVDGEWDISQYEIDVYKPIISKKFNITGQSDEEIKKRLTQMLIYFEKLQTTEITQLPSLTSTDLVANVGGLLGK